MKKSALESFVESYLRTHTRKSLATVYVQKAIVLINEKLTPSCCDDPLAEVDLITRMDNNLTIGVRDFLKTVAVNGNKKSYKRTVKLLEKFIGIPCCS